MPLDEVASALLARVDAADIDGVLALLPDLSDPIRAQVWEVLSGALSRPPSPAAAPLTADDRTRRRRAQAVVALAVGPPDVVRIVGAWVFLPESPSDVDSALASRTPQWRDAFVVATLRELASEPEVGLMGPFWWGWWQQVRLRERNGVLHPDPTSAPYLVLMARGLLFSGSIVDAVAADPALAAGPIWSLFHPAPGVQRALLGAERYWDPSNTWRVALVRLALAGLLDPQQLASSAAAAAEDERMGRNHRAWYRKIPTLLADPRLLPEPPQQGPPPAGNRLQR